MSNIEEAPVSAWDSRPVNPPTVAQEADSPPVTESAPSSPASATSSAPAPVVPAPAVDADARQAIGELHRLITDIGQQTRAACKATDDDVSTILKGFTELADRVRALELHATNPAGHDAPAPAPAPAAPSSPAAAGG